MLLLQKQTFPWYGPFLMWNLFVVAWTGICWGFLQVVVIMWAIAVPYSGSSGALVPGNRFQNRYWSTGWGWDRDLAFWMTCTLAQITEIVFHISHQILCSVLRVFKILRFTMYMYTSPTKLSLITMYFSSLLASYHYCRCNAKLNILLVLYNGRRRLPKLLD